MKKRNYKAREFGESSEPQWKTYARLVVGTTNIFVLIRYELITFFCQGLGGAFGLLARKKLYPLLIGKKCKNLTIGKNVTLRHPHKIHIGESVIIDDNCVIDAKGETNKGINIGNNVFIGRNTIIYTKNGDISIGDSVNIGVNSDIYSKNKLSIGNNTMIAGYSYIMSGGQYDYKDPTPFAEQDSSSKGATIVGENCWLGARVTIADNTRVGDGTVIGASAVVTSDIPPNAVAIGIPAKVIKNRF